MIVYHGTAALFADGILRTGLRAVNVTPRFELTLQHAYTHAEVIRASRGGPLRGAVAIADAPEHSLEDVPSDEETCRLDADDPLRTEIVQYRVAATLRVSEVLLVRFVTLDGSDAEPVITRVHGDTSDLTRRELERIYNSDVSAIPVASRVLKRNPTDLYLAGEPRDRIVERPLTPEDVVAQMNRGAAA